MRTLDFDGDGGPAVEALIGYPRDVAIDLMGRLLFSDGWNGVIRRIDSNGIITTIAGTGVRGYSGDGGPATEAQIGECLTIDVDSQGRVLLGDTSMNRIRRIERDGTIQTIAGNGTRFYGGDGGPYTEASFAIPGDLVFGTNGEVFVADYGNYRIRRIGANGMVGTFAGTGEVGSTGNGGPALQATLNPQDLALAPDGTLYVLEDFPYLRRINPDGTIHKVSGDGENGYNGDGLPAIHGRFFRPRDICLGRAGELYIADTENNRVRAIGTDGILRTIIGDGTHGSGGDGGPAIDAQVNRPAGVHVTSDGTLYFTESSGARVRLIDPSGIVHLLAGGSGAGFSGDGGPALDAQLSLPAGIWVDEAAGAVYFTDSGNNRVRRVDADGIIETVAGNGGIAYNGDDIPATQASIRNPVEIVGGPEGVLYVVSAYSGLVRSLTPVDDVPVGWSSLTAAVEGGRVRLQWSSATGTPVQYELHREGPAGSSLVDRWRSSDQGLLERLDSPPAGQWDYRLEVHDEGGLLLATLGPVRVSVGGGLPSSLRIAQIWPNPANPRVRVELELPRPGHVIVDILDARGRMVQRIADREMAAGRPQLEWAGQDAGGRPVASGAYRVVVRVRGGGERVGSVVLVR